jgi:hypothetical protein
VVIESTAEGIGKHFISSKEGRTIQDDKDYHTANCNNQLSISQIIT